MKIAIIGAASGQLPLCLKAREMGIQTICFAWEKGAVCKDFVDKFYPISITEKDAILAICEEEQINGVVSNASDPLAEVVAFIAEKMNLHGNNYNSIINIRDKGYVRQHTENISGLESVQNVIYTGIEKIPIPCVVKPSTGAAKRGVSFVHDMSMFNEALQYAQDSEEKILVEEYIEGREVSVESISYEGKHYILQVTDKDNSGYPHFVELGHHQPSTISPSVRLKLESVVSSILDNLNFQNGATHVEFRIDKNDKIYLIEVNPRGGGDNISSKLVELSTGYDYIKGMIEVSLGTFKKPKVNNLSYVGIYYLCKQTEDKLFLFTSSEEQPWLIEKEISSLDLNESTSNYDRNGYLIYQSDKKIELN